MESGKEISIVDDNFEAKIKEAWKLKATRSPNSKEGGNNGLELMKRLTLDGICKVRQTPRPVFLS